MKARIVKLYDYWVVEFPFATVIYCDTWTTAVRELNKLDQHLARTVEMAEVFDMPFKS